jgi:hypothetical protein
MKYNPFSFITACTLLSSALCLGCNIMPFKNPPKHSPAITVSDETMRKCYLSLWDDTTDAKQFSENLITVISAKPLAGVAYHSALFAPLGRISKSRRITEEAPRNPEQEWIRDWQNIVLHEQGARKIASQIILARSYILIRAIELERQRSLHMHPAGGASTREQKTETEEPGKEYFPKAMRIFDDILKDRHARDFHPLCRILRARALMENPDEKRGKRFLARELAALEKVNSDYKLIVEEFKLDQQLRDGIVGIDLVLDIRAKKFELYMAQPIDKIKLWENPIPILGAFEIAMNILPSAEKMQRIQRLLPLLNDNNDPPSPAPEIRTILYSELIHLYQETGDTAQAKANAQKALQIVKDKKKRASFEEILNGH